VVRLEVAKPVHQSALVPTIFALAPHNTLTRLAVAPCDTRATDRLRPRIMPPVTKLEVAKAVHPSALAPTTFALGPHRPVNLSPETATQAMYMAWDATRTQ
jgi:hypothetical protein